jgi:hypothetical protein
MGANLIPPEILKLVPRQRRIDGAGNRPMPDHPWFARVSWPSTCARSPKRSFMGMPKDLSSRLPAPRPERRRSVPSRRERSVCSTTLPPNLLPSAPIFYTRGGLPGPKGGQAAAARAIHQGHVRDDFRVAGKVAPEVIRREDGQHHRSKQRVAGDLPPQPNLGSSGLPRWPASRAFAAFGAGANLARKVETQARKRKTRELSA